MRKPNDLTDEIKVLPVAVIHSAGETKPTLEALRDGGIPAAEITFRTPCAAEAIRIGCKAFPDMHIGAGTVINAVQATAADAIGFRPVSIRKRAEVRRFYAPSALKNGNGLSDSSYVTSSLSPFPIASENLLGSVLGKMKSEKNFLCETQEGSL